MSAILPSNNVEIKLSQHLAACEKNNSYNLKGAVKSVLHWFEVSKQRKQLARLDDRMLKDIGLNRAEIQSEITKPFWK